MEREEGKTYKNKKVRGTGRKAREIADYCEA
jgi:hypothetical protein